MKKTRRIIVSTLILSMIISLASGSINSSLAAKKPKLSKKITLTVGQKKTVKIKNAVKSAKVKWKTSSKKVAKIAKKVSKGKKAKATIKGVAAGTATITAAYKAGKMKKNMKCKVTVNSKTTPLDNVAATGTPNAPAANGTATPAKPDATATEKPGPTPEPSEDMKALLDTIVIKDAEEVRGNILLPTAVEDATIEWSSSDKDVITDVESDGKPAGVVTRGAEDKTVTLTATVVWNGETATKEIEVVVLKAPEPITEDDYAGYLFGHFISESNADGEQIYFATSSSRLKFTDMNKRQPVLRSTVGEKGVRDPFLYRSPEGDKFFLIATDLSIFNRGGWRINAQGYYDPSCTGSHNLVLWQTTDLANWGEPKLIHVAPENAGMAWAPEMIYDDVSGQYIIFFASSIMNPETKYKAKPNAIYYVATRDFETFSETKLLIDNQTDGETGGKAREIIDTTILKIGDWFYSVSKDGDNNESNGGIRIMKTQTLLDSTSWVKVCDLDELGLNLAGQRINRLTNATLEGPELFQFNKCDWADPNTPEYVLMADQYGAGAGYLPMTTTDIEDTSGASWKILSSGTDYSFDQLRKRHGTIMRITQDELDIINEAYGNN